MDCFFCIAVTVFVSLYLLLMAPYCNGKPYYLHVLASVLSKLVDVQFLLQYKLIIPFLFGFMEQNALTNIVTRGQCTIDLIF